MKKVVLIIITCILHCTYSHAVEYNFTPLDSGSKIEEMDVNEAYLQEEVVPNEVGKFYITKVNRAEKLWVLSPLKRDFLGSRGITKYDYARLIPPEDRGEDYVVSWSYGGDVLKEDVIIRFEYTTVYNPVEQLKKEPYTAEYVYHGIKRGSFNWTFQNIGSDFVKLGRVDTWKVSIIYQDQVVAVKRSAMWYAIEGN